MELNRRTFITGAAAVSALPAFSLELPKVVDPRITKIKQQFSDHLHWYQSGKLPGQGDALDELHLMAEKVCHKMVDLQPKMFLDRTLGGPSSLMVWPDIDGLAIDQYEFYHINSTRRSYRLDLKPPINEIDTDWVAKELLRELRRDINQTRQRYMSKGQSYYTPGLNFKNPTIYTWPPMYIMYMPAIPVRHVYPGDFTPRIGFQRRGNFTYGKSRVFRNPEDLQLELARTKYWEAEWAKQGGI